ncbi:MAG: hypothetical protein ACFB15_17245 [Cyclobacteriaceae bacterium]
MKKSLSVSLFLLFGLLSFSACEEEDVMAGRSYSTIKQPPKYCYSCPKDQKNIDLPVDSLYVWIEYHY